MGLLPRHSAHYAVLRRERHHTAYTDASSTRLSVKTGAVMSDGFKGRAKDVQALAQEEGVLVLQAGPDVVRLAPSLIIDEADMAEGMARLRAALRRMVG